MHASLARTAVLVGTFASSGLAAAADATYGSEASFVAAVAGATIESFETLAARMRTVAPVLTAGFTVSSSTTPVGVQSGVDTPEAAFGAVATAGTHFLSVYLPPVGNVLQPQGTLVFDLAAPATAFAFNITDVGEVAGVVRLATNAGAYAGGVDLVTYPPTFANGNVQFVGLQQSVPFTRVSLTVTGLDDAYGLDKVYVLTAVPEPASALLLLAGGALLAARRRPNR